MVTKNNAHEPILLTKEDIFKQTQKLTSILSLPIIRTNSPPLHENMYCKVILFFASNAKKFKLVLICSCGVKLYNYLDFAKLSP